MLASQIITDVRRELIETSAQFWSDAELLRLINRAELDFTNKTRILEDSAQLTLVTGRLEYPLPGNWVSSRMVMHKTVNSDGTYAWHRIIPTNLEKMGQTTQNFLNTSTDNQGQPTKYWIWNRSLWLNRAPNDEHATSLYLFYKSKPISLTSTSSEINIDDSLSEAINEYVLWKAWKKEGEDDTAAEHELAYQKYVLEGRRWSKKQQGDRRVGMDIVSSVDIEQQMNPFSPFGSQ